MQFVNSWQPNSTRFSDLKRGVKRSPRLLGSSKLQKQQRHLGNDPTTNGGPKNAKSPHFLGHSSSLGKNTTKFLVRKEDIYDT